ncbi:LBF_2017 N-terminal domain-containing protein [Leptospira kanakyensis]|uniref:LBF_2017 N-terminal domain-containing protein n=1 Tax=Leptospira kanakyensis TaxID=2484968 RepID=UPI00223E7653|nr:hypothetical protein [Leptospira kanakyensis]MCW7471166.1 hypothetical protein [Leptospira kanakyensis]MCW7481901.1 hypothetical protein [Leptospira kanakyensis]
MNPIILFRACLFVCLFLLASIPIFSESKTIKFTLEPDRDDIIQYEFELWKQSSFDLEIPFRVLSNPGKIQLFIPNGYEYFRIRAVAKRQVRGFWTDLYTVSTFGQPKPKEPTKVLSRKPNTADVLVPISNAKGTNHFFLTENKIQVKPILTHPMKTSVRYRLNGGAWKTTKLPELSFSKDGDYKLEYQVTNELGVSDSMQVWEFSVDNTPPKTEFHWQPETYKKSSIQYVSKNTNLQLTAIDDGSGLDTIRFRTTCGKIPQSDWFEWDQKNSWMGILNSCSNDLEIEISAIDRLGNEEIPKKIYLKRNHQGN